MRYFWLTCICVVVVLAFFCTKHNVFSKKGSNVAKDYFNIVLVGAAGSGKGTQGELLKKEFNLLPISMGEVMREYRKDENAKYSKILTEYMDKGQLVPSEITHEIMAEYLEKNIFCSSCIYNGVIFDGFPRQMKQLEFLDEFLAKKGSKIDAVVHIDVPMEMLVDRLSGRFSCAKCGELYHKTTKPTKVANVCDKCGSTEFKVREDDKDKNAIRERFRIFEETTSAVLSAYKDRGIVIRVDGNRSVKDISDEIISKLKEVVDDKSNSNVGEDK